MSVKSKTKSIGGHSGHRNFGYDHGSDAGSLKLGSQTCLSGEKAGQDTYKYESMPKRIAKSIMGRDFLIDRFK